MDNREVNGITIKYQQDNCVDHSRVHNAGTEMPKCPACDRSLQEPYTKMLFIHTVNQELSIREHHPNCYICACGCVWSIASLVWVAKKIEGLS